MSRDRLMDNVFTLSDGRDLLLETKLERAQACIRDSWRGIKRSEWKATHAIAIAEAFGPAQVGEKAQGEQ